MKLLNALASGVKEDSTTVEEMHALVVGDTISVDVRGNEKLTIGEGVLVREEVDVNTIALEGLEVNELSPDLVILVETDGDCEDDVITDTLGESIPVKLALFENNEDDDGTREKLGQGVTLGEDVEEVVLDDESDIIDDRDDEIETTGELELINEREEDTVTRAFEGVFCSVERDVIDEIPLVNVVIELIVDIEDNEGNGDVDESVDDERETRGDIEEILDNDGKVLTLAKREPEGLRVLILESVCIFENVIEELAIGVDDIIVLCDPSIGLIVASGVGKDVEETVASDETLGKSGVDVEFGEPVNLAVEVCDVVVNDDSVIVIASEDEIETLDDGECDAGGELLELTDEEMDRDEKEDRVTVTIDVTDF